MESTKNIFTTSDFLDLIDSEIKECSEMSNSHELRPGQQKIWAIREDAYYDLKRKFLKMAITPGRQPGARADN